MYLNDLNSAKHNVDKLNRILSQTFNHEVDLSEMSTDSLNRMLSTTQAKMMAIKENDFKYWENAQYNKLGLIQHQLKTYLNEIAPARTDGKTMKAKNESVVMEDDLEQAEVMLAAQELVDELQGMVEDVAEMQVQKLMPIVDAMKEQVGFEQAEAYNNAADGALAQLLDAMKTAKGAVENATLTARGEAPQEAMPTDMGMSDADMDPQAPIDGAKDMDMDSDDFGGDEADAGEENPIGRELKGESALADMEGKALSEKKFLESKDRLFKMVESGKMTQEHFINIINQLTEDPDRFAQADRDSMDKLAKSKMDRFKKADRDSMKSKMDRFKDADRASMPMPTPDEVAMNMFRAADQASMDKLAKSKMNRFRAADQASMDKLAKSKMNRFKKADVGSMPNIMPNTPDLDDLMPPAQNIMVKKGFPKNKTAVMTPIRYQGR